MLAPFIVVIATGIVAFVVRWFGHKHNKHKYHPGEKGMELRVNDQNKRIRR